MYSIIQSYDHQQTVLLHGRTFPAVCLVEDVDGIRFLLIDDRPIPVTVWVTAHTNGAQGILRTDGHFITNPQFAELRREQGLSTTAAYTLEPQHWVRVEAGTYMQMIDHLPDPEELRFVHLHVHSEFSALDGLSTVEEIVQAAADDGQTAIGLTDHGLCAGHPVLQLTARRQGLKPIFGMEAYFTDNRLVPGNKSNDYHHLVLWAMNDVGLRNLWAMSTESYRDGLWHKPRIDWDTLERLNEGVLASTACLGGPLLGPWLEGTPEKGLANLGRLKAIFGDRLYIEIHVNQLAEQIRANHWLLEVCDSYGIEPIAVADSHYAHPDDQYAHRVWLSVQTNKDVQDETTMFAGNQQYHLMTEKEIRAFLSYLPASFVDKAVTNTARLAQRCTAEMSQKNHNPVYSRVTPENPDPVQHDIDRIFDICTRRWSLRTQNKSYPQQVALDRFEREMTLLIKKGYCGYYLMNWDLVSYAKDNGVLVGPGRGSSGGSYVAYVMGITEVDPIEGDILFERFMTEGRTALPDFDIDYPSSKKDFMLEYASRRFGADHIAIVGTHLRLKNKGAINDTARALRSTLPDSIFVDQKDISRIIDEAEASTAGLGLSWDELWDQHGDQLEPFFRKYPHLFEMAGQLRGRLKTYSKHAAGVVIDPDNVLTGALPLWRAAEGTYLVTQFDKDVLEELGYVKFDMLNIANLDIVQEAADLIHARTGRRITPYDWRDEYTDPFVWDELSDGWTLGVFQVGTQSGTRLVKQFRPTSIAELSDVITLVRPGPTRSGLTDMYLRRRSGTEEVSFVDARLESVLAKTHGTMLYQEDIMAVCMVLAAYGSDEADEVRKILGKKKVELAAKAGRKFMARAIDNGTDPESAALLWSQMEEFAKYSFGKGHAYAYALVAFWTSWLKFHYPIEFLCAALSNVKEDRIASFVEEARRMGYQVLPPDINQSDKGFTALPMSVRYGLTSLVGIGESAADAILEHRPYQSWEDFQERKGSKCNAGHVKILVQIGAFDSLVPNRRGLEHLLADTALPGAEKCVHRGDLVVDLGLPCRYDWAQEPPVLGRTGKPLKAKPIPKKCTRACRRFEERSLLDPLTIEPYTDEDIRRIEMEMLGVYLSTTPFSRIPDEDRQSVATATDVLTGPAGTYLIAALVKKVRKVTDKNDRPMAFLTVATERGDLEITVFSRQWAQYEPVLTRGTLAYASITKNSRGQTLDYFVSLDE